MQLGLATHDAGPFATAVQPMVELGAYEALWCREGMTLKRMADLFRGRPDALPTDFVERGDARSCALWVQEHFEKSGLRDFGVRLNGTSDYPTAMRDARHPVEVVVFEGDWSWVFSPGVSIVGTRKPSDEGLRRATRLSRMLAERGFTVVSGLAAGIDTAAHEAALGCGRPTIAVLGTPLSVTYPARNRDLRRRIARNGCVVSHVPARRFASQDYRRNRFFFPQRNALMSALSRATVIVEAGETSGTLIQARAALQQGRKLFILDSCFRDPSLTWPAKLTAKGAIRVTDFEVIPEHLSPETAW